MRLGNTRIDNGTVAVYSTSSSAVSSSTFSISIHPDLEPFASSYPGSYTFDQGSNFISHRYTSTLEYSAIATGRLTMLELRNCSGIRPHIISSFFVNLVLGGISITDEALDSLTETPLTRLQSLGLLDCGEISDETMVALMFNCEQITKLAIFGSFFTLRTFSSISLHLVHLQELHLEHVPLVLNESLQDILIKCTKLRVLKLWHCRNLTQDLFADEPVPCSSLEELEYMDKFPRPYAHDTCETQVRFLKSLVVRFERLKTLRLAKLADVTWVQVNPGLDQADLKELRKQLPTLVHIGVGVSDSLSEEELLKFAKSYNRPGVQMYKRMLESSDELEQFVG
ncbi:hypothetical protein BGZ65_007512 [Modicella reniformis]|uniref:Uncharacterized protein n=1 Tax=Modicella reniformis TaxID=1440133 RepID=A0A9P6IVQ5_9FUNG|nr:hypothetical protein BGZ65_007512 [Modicella reniformis]